MLPTITHIHMSVIPRSPPPGRSSWTRGPTRRSTTAARSRGRAAPPSAASASRIPANWTSCCSAEADPHPPRLHGRREQHDRQRSGPARLRRGRAHATARCSTSTTRTASASSASAGRRDLALRRRATASSGTWARPTTASCSSAASPRRTRRCWRSSPARPSSRSCSRSRRRRTCTPGPSPVASLATVLAGFEVNERRGDASAPTLHALTARPARGLDRLDVDTPNRRGCHHRDPAARPPRIDDVGRFLFERGIYVTLAAYPLVPRDEVGFRIQVTAANTDEEIDRAIAALEELVERGELRSARAAADRTRAAA